MLNSKFDLYETEWLDLVFAQRNKNYGAYDLRQHYGDNMVKAMLIAIVSVSAIFIGVSFAIRQKPVEPVREVQVKLDDHIVTAQPPKKVEPAKPAEAAAPKTPPVATTRFVQMVVTSAPVTEEPPKIDEIKGAVGPEEIKIPGGGEPVLNASPAGTGGTGVAPVSNEPVDAGTGVLEVMPEPNGGAAGWSKFLQKNLRFPRMAQEQGVSGKVFVSFIVERDGKLSNFTILRAANYGFDEESLRVLKLAPAWRPGVQNGQPVRVRYTLPISFLLGDE